MADQVLRLVITGNSTAATKELRKLQRDLGKISNNLQNMGRALTLGLTVPLAAAGAAALKFAMDAQESENLFRVSLGKMEKAARQWSEEFSDATGSNEYAVRKMLGTFDLMIKNMGIAEKEALKMSEAMTGLAYDMSSFYNIPVEEALQKLQAGLSGEVEPLKRLGIVVNETAVKQFAWKNGIAETGEKLTETQKVIARYRLIMEQTSQAQGDLARTADSPANKIRILKERGTELAVTYGTLLIPVMERLTELAGQFAKWLESLNPKQQQWVVNLGLLAAALGPVIWAISKAIAFIRVMIGLYSQVAAASAKSAATQVAGNEAVAASAQHAASATKGAGAAAAASKAGWLSLMGPLSLIAIKLTAVAAAGVIAGDAIAKVLKNPNLGKLGVNGNTSTTAGPKTPKDNHNRSQEYATGGIAFGPTSGYGVTLHGPEAVIPLSPRYRSQGLDVAAKALKALGASSGPTIQVTGLEMNPDTIRLAVMQGIRASVPNGRYL